jgi:hypothetical protein
MSLSVALVSGSIHNCRLAARGAECGVPTRADDDRDSTEG